MSTAQHQRDTSGRSGLDMVGDQEEASWFDVFLSELQSILAPCTSGPGTVCWRAEDWDPVEVGDIVSVPDKQTGQVIAVEPSRGMFPLCVRTSDGETRWYAEERVKLLRLRPEQEASFRARLQAETAAAGAAPLPEVGGVALVEDPLVNATQASLAVPPKHDVEKNGSTGKKRTTSTAIDEADDVSPAAVALQGRAGKKRQPKVSSAGGATTGTRPGRQLPAPENSLMASTLASAAQTLQSSPAHLPRRKANEPAQEEEANSQPVDFEEQRRQLSLQEAALAELESAEFVSAKPSGEQRRELELEETIVAELESAEFVSAKPMDANATPSTFVAGASPGVFSITSGMDVLSPSDEPVLEQTLAQPEFFADFGDAPDATWIGPGAVGEVAAAPPVQPQSGLTTGMEQGVAHRKLVDVWDDQDLWAEAAAESTTATAAAPVDAGVSAASPESTVDAAGASMTATSAPKSGKDSAISGNADANGNSGSPSLWDSSDNVTPIHQSCTELDASSPAQALRQKADVFTPEGEGSTHAANAEEQRRELELDETAVAELKFAEFVSATPLEASASLGAVAAASSLGGVSMTHNTSSVSPSSEQMQHSGAVLAPQVLQPEFVADFCDAPGNAWIGAGVVGEVAAPAVQPQAQAVFATSGKVPVAVQQKPIDVWDDQDLWAEAAAESLAAAAATAQADASSSAVSPETPVDAASAPMPAISAPESSKESADNGLFFDANAS